MNELTTIRLSNGSVRVLTNTDRIEELERKVLYLNERIKSISNIASLALGIAVGIAVSQILSKVVIP